MRCVDLNEVVKSFKKMIQRMIGEPIELRISLDQAACAIEADAGQSDQVLLNLAVNAKDAGDDEQASFLQKPFTVECLTQKIRRLLD